MPGYSGCFFCVLEGDASEQEADLNKADWIELDTRNTSYLVVFLQLATDPPKPTNSIRLPRLLPHRVRRYLTALMRPAPGTGHRGVWKRGRSCKLE